MYARAASSPDALGLLAEALIKRGAPMPLLPAGEARIEKTGEATVRSSAGAERHIVGYAITGLELTPTRVWMNLDGTWFGDVMPWFSVIPEGVALIKLLRDEKITMVAGTDELAGLFLHHELALFVRAGIPSAEAIRMATLDAARSMKQDKKSGSIGPGKNADLFVVDGDPIANIEDIGNVSSTMRGGVIFASDPLYAAVGVGPKR